MHIPLSEETLFFGPASWLHLFCLLTKFRTRHFSVFGEIQFSIRGVTSAVAADTFM